MKVAIIHMTCIDKYYVDLVWDNGKTAIKEDQTSYTKTQAQRKAKRIADKLHLPIVYKKEDGC